MHLYISKSSVSTRMKKWNVFESKYFDYLIHSVAPKCRVVAGHIADTQRYLSKS